MIGKASFILATATLLISCTLIASGDEEEAYESKYDDVDVDTILANDKKRNQYMVCYFDVTRCMTADAKYFHDKFSEAVTTQCRKCNPKQVEILNKVTDWYTKNEPDTWKRIMEKAIDDLKHTND